MNKENFCYHLPEEVAEVEGVCYYCADKDGVSDFEGDVVLNFTGHPNVPHLDIPELAQHVNDIYKEIVIAWPDLGIPRVKPTFWHALHSYIVSQGWKNVCIHCEGGHGRTGTAMSALLISLGGWSISEAVGYVRTMYCEKAVETPDQCDYLCELDEALNGRKIRVEDIPIPSVIIEAEKARKAKEINDKKLVMKTTGLCYNIDEEDDDISIRKT